MKLKKKMKTKKFHLIKKKLYFQFKKKKYIKKKHLIIQRNYYMIKRIKKMERNPITKETKKNPF